MRTHLSVAHELQSEPPLRGFVDSPPFAPPSAPPSAPRCAQLLSSVQRMGPTAPAAGSAPCGASKPHEGPTIRISSACSSGFGVRSACASVSAAA